MIELYVSSIILFKISYINIIAGMYVYPDAFRTLCDVIDNIRKFRLCLRLKKSAHMNCRPKVLAELLNTYRVLCLPFSRTLHYRNLKGKQRVRRYKNELWQLLGNNEENK